MSEEKETSTSSPAVPPLAGGADGPAPPPLNTAAGQAIPVEQAAPAQHSRINPWLLLTIVALAFSVWQWLETRTRLVDLQQEMARGLASSASEARTAQVVQQQTQNQLMALQSRFGALESRMHESQSQQAALENLYQDLARNRDESALVEAELGVAQAAQQLQLAGNVEGAVLALQTADLRLADTARPQFIGIRKALARDLDRLQALPKIDLPGMSARIESVLVAIDTLPLAINALPDAKVEDAERSENTESTTESGNAEMPAVAAAPQTPVENSVWRQLLADIWREIRGLIRIERLDYEPVLLAPEQVFFLRENIKLRLLNARLAMLSRDQTIFRSELQVVEGLLNQHFDRQSTAVGTAQNTLQQLASAGLVMELPTLNESLSAIRSFRSRREGPAQ